MTNSGKLLKIRVSLPKLLHHIFSWKQSHRHKTSNQWQSNSFYSFSFKAIYAFIRWCKRKGKPDIDVLPHIISVLLYELLVGTKPELKTLIIINIRSICKEEIQVHCRMSDLWSGQKDTRNRLVCIIRIADHGCKGNSRDPPTAHQSDSVTEALIEVDVNIDLNNSCCLWVIIQ